MYEQKPNDVHLDSSGNLRVRDVYFGGAILMKYLSDKLGEDVHSQINGDHVSDDNIIRRGLQSVGLTPAETLVDFSEWLEGLYGQVGPTDGCD